METMTADPVGSAEPTDLPDRSVVPSVWARYTDLVIERGEGSWLITRDGERYLDYTSGIGVTNTGHAHPRVAAAVAAQAQKLLHGQQNIVYHEPGLRLHERLAALPAGGPWRRLPLELRRRGDRGLREARASGHRASGDRRVPLRIPRPHRPGDVADDRQGVDRARCTSRCRAPSTTPTTLLLPGAGRTARPVRLHVRLGGAPRSPLPPGRRPRAGGRGHRRAGHRRGRLHRPAAGLPAATSRDHPRARHPARRRRGPDGLRADRASCSRSSTGASSRTSSSSPRASRRACRCRGSSRAKRAPRGTGRRAHTAARMAATSCPARRPSRRSMSSRARGSWRMPGSAARSCWPACGRWPPLPADRRCPRPRPDGGDRARPSGRRRRARARTPISRSGSSRRRSGGS